ncbi:NUDIX domain-containing protein [Spirillospora sp. NPDC046719]
MRAGRGGVGGVGRARPRGAALGWGPAARVEPGEDDAAALVRELKEETGLDVVAGALAGSVDRPGPGGVVYEIHDYEARAVGGVLRAGDDAADARWVTAAELRELPLTDGLVEALESWGLLGP